MNDHITKKAALIIAIISSFVTPFLSSAVNVALPSMARLFQIDAVILSWVATSYLLASVVFLVPFGRLADIHGRKRMLLWGYIVFTISTLGCGLANTVPVLLLFRIIQGFSSAMIFATGMAIVVSAFPPQERGRVLGITVSSVYVGLSAGPFIGGFLTEYLSWRGVFLVNVPLGLIIIFLVLYKLRGEWAEAKGEKFDTIGSLIYGFGIIALIYGLTHLSTFKGLCLIIFGILVMYAFVKWETRVESPVFQLALFKHNRVFAFSNLAALIHYSATSGVSFLLSLYLQHIKALSPQEAGLVLIAQPIVQALFSPLAGILSDKIEPRIVSTLGMAITTLGLLSFVFLTQSTGLPIILSTLLILGFGFALFSSPNMNAVMSSVEKKFFGLASGSTGTMRMFGMVISMGVATLVFNHFIGRVQITPEVYPVFTKSIKIAFLIFTIFCVAGVFASMVRGRVRPLPGPEMVK